MTRASVVLATTLVLAAATLTACGEPDPDDTGVADALERLPPRAGEGLTTVRYTNLARVREEAGLEVPDVDDDDALAEFARATAGLGDDDVVLAFPTRYDEVAVLGQATERFGFSWVQADLVVDLQSSDGGLGYYGFDDDVEVPDELGEQDDEGVYAADDDTGVPLLAVDGPRAALTTEEQAAEAWLDEDDESLADDDAFGALAEAVDDEEAITAVLTTLGDDRAIGIGLSVDDDEPGFVVAYWLGSDDEAEGAVDQLTDAYADVGELDVDDVRADGRVVAVTGRQDQVAAPYRLFTQFQLPIPE